MSLNHEKGQKKLGSLGTLMVTILDYGIGITVYIIVILLARNFLGSALDLSTFDELVIVVGLSILGSFLGGMVAGFVTGHGISMRWYLLINALVILGGVHVLLSLFSSLNNLTTACQNPLTLWEQIGCGFFIIFWGGFLVIAMLILLFLLILLAFHAVGTHVGADIRKKI